METEKMNFTPKAFIFTIRELGYKPHQSIADIIDNSIAKNAKNIFFNIYTLSNYSAKYISIMDDGEGMTEQELSDKAMRWGPEFDKIREQNDLGKFGFGLKAASLAHCQIMTVITKKNGKISHRRVDADHIFKTNEFESFTERTPDMEEHINKLNRLESGTVVIWQNLKRLLDAETVSIRNSHLPMLKIRERTKKHLAMTFSQMMNKIKIHVNTVTGDDNPIEQWDPFLKNHKETRVYPETKIDYKGSQISVKPYILPSKKILMNEGKKTYEYFAGYTENWLDRQGFYIFRKNRLIVPGDWLELGNVPMQRREKYNQLRIKVNYDGHYDEDWKINLMKTDVRVPALIKNKLTTILNDLIKDLKKMNYFRSPIVTNKGEKSPWSVLNNYGTSKYKIDRTHPIVSNILNRGNNDKNELEDAFKLIENMIPVSNSYISEEKDNNRSKTKDNGQTLEANLKIALELKNKGYEDNDIIKKMLSLNNLHKEIN